MYKVMLVDDDYPTIQFLSEVIEWEELGMTLMGTYENGLQAFEAAQKEMPDILVTDIGMPKMNGIELTREMKKIKNNLQVAIISCHNEFAYAQQALKLEVQDYILKETLESENLQTVLLSCKEQLDRNHNRIDEVKKLQRQVKMNHDLEKQRLLQQMIQGSSTTLLELLTAPLYIPVHYFIHNYYEVKKEFISIDILQFAMQNFIQEMVQTQQNIHCIHFEYQKGFIFYPCQASIKHDSFGELRVLLQQFRNVIKEYLSVDITFILGKQGERRQVRQEIQSLLSSERQLFYSRRDTVINKTEQSLTDQQDQEIFSHFEEAGAQLKNVLFERDIETLKKKLTDWINICVDKRYHPQVVKEWFLRLMLDVNMQLRTIPKQSSHVEVLQEEIFYLNTIYELQDWLIHFVEKTLQKTSQHLKNKYHKDVIKACYYVSHHLHKKLSLDEVAEHLYLNPSYFSRLFKKEMQITFVEYVKQCKMEQAKDLLERTDISVGGICAQLGYDHQSYFIKVFKKQVGCTPLEYRGMKWNGVKAK
ncbi:response regulator transcription factor [Gracilibacillus phocaeensis]|uniref:response regulator transcription factor n=1 Tax=Gracilibacillus phocaeensis TaxID=2042304 RepID=UPI00102FAD41|nr:AraC family transcriptional regulator [Gracilibacillus phocaeensis]